MVISLSGCIVTKTQQRVPGLLYGKLDAAFYSNPIVRLANMGSDTLTCELTPLAAPGLLQVRQEGNQIYY